VKVLFVSNYYPPASHGGYEQWCLEAAAELTRRGHDVTVLCSRVGQPTLEREADGVEVRRALHLEVDAGLLTTSLREIRSPGRLERENLAEVRRTVAEVQPDVALLWGMWNVSRSVPALIEDLLAERVAYYLCDYWPALPSARVQQWEAPARRRSVSIPKGLVGRCVAAQLRRRPLPALELAHPICVSRALCDGLVQQGVDVRHAQIIYGGTDTSSRACRQPSRAAYSGLRLIYAGRLTPGKGVHTAVAALAQVPDARVTLDIVGEGEPEYERLLRDQVGALGLRGRVAFHGRVPHKSVTSMLGMYDALLLTSEWPEPFARVTLEAMAAGVVVIAALTGGTEEVVLEGETGLTFSPADARGLADQIRRLSADRGLRQTLAQAARRVVEERFTLTRMLDALEHELHEIAYSTSPVRA
jgi:glycogen(starch) synthase